MKISLRMLLTTGFLWAGAVDSIFSFCTFHSAYLNAQTFTEYLTRSRAGEGSVVLHQDSELDALVNGRTNPTPATTPRTQAPHAADTAATSPESAIQMPVLGRRMRASGYRIQVYAGGNNRQAKAEAYRQAGLVRSTFDNVTVYTKFISPRWTCRVGDFRTYEEATDMLRRMRETQKFREAAIVKSQIIVIY